MADTPITTATTALLAGGAPLQSLGSSVTVKSMFQQGQLYIGVDSTSSLLGYACAMATVNIVATMPKPTSAPFYTLEFLAMAPDNVLNTVTTPISTSSPSSRVRVPKITAMATSTRLGYIIIARDDGAGVQKIYALPRVSSEFVTNTNAGLIADFTQIHLRYSARPMMFSERYFGTVISDPSQIQIGGPFDAQISVGAGSLPIDAGVSISDLYSIGDCVYAVISQPYTATQSPGTFKSQAIFAQDGHIVNWTPWSRVLGSDDQMIFSYVDSQTISGYYIAKEATTFRSVYQTTFTNSSSMAVFLSIAGSAPGGIQGVFNFPQQTSGFNNALSLLISTGYNNVTIGQTGKSTSGAFKVLEMTGSNVLTYFDPNLNNQKAIVAAEIAHDGSGNHFIFSGGSTGLSILTGDITGYSWTGTLANIEGLLTGGQNWKLVIIFLI